MNRIIKKLLLLGSMACIFFSILSTVFIYNPKVYASDVIEKPGTQQITEIRSIVSQSIKINASQVNSRKKIEASFDSDMKSDMSSDMKALSANTQNLIVNGDFEYDPTYYGSWELYSVNGRGTPTFTWDNISHGNGESSVKISGKRITAFIGNTVSITPGKVYSLSTWSKGSAVSVLGDEIGSFISIQQYDKDGNYIDSSERSVSSKGTFGWTPTSIHFVADPKADSVFILLALDGSGSVWYDDVSLVETGNIPAGEINRYIPYITYKGFNVSLDGAKYSNVAGTDSTYQWEIQSKPDGSLTTLANSNNKVISLVPDVAGDYILSLTVSNGSTTIAQKQVTVKSKEFNDATDDTVDDHMSQATSNYTNGYTLRDMIPLTDGWLLVGDIVNSKIIFYNVFTGEVGKQYQLQAVPERIDFDFNSGIILATQANTNRIAKIDVHSNTITYITTKYKNADVIFGEGNIAFACSSWWDYTSNENAISIIDINQNNELSTSTSNGVGGGFLAYDKNKNNLLLGNEGTSPSTLMRFQYDETNQKLTYKEQLRAGGNAQDLAISNDGLHVAYPNGGGNGDGYTIFDIDSSNVTNKFGEWDTGAYPSAAAFSGDNSFIVTTDRDAIKLFDVNTHELIKTYSEFPNMYYVDVYKVGVSRGDKLIFGDINGTSVGNTNRRIYFNTVSSSTHTPEITLDRIYTNTPSPQLIGTPIQISADASGSADMQYQFMIFDGYSWTVGQAYSENHTFSWMPDNEGNYSIVVEVKDNNSYFGYDAYGVLNYSIETPVPISLKANPLSLTLVQGQSEALPTITGTLRNGSTMDVTNYSTFTSKNAKVATVENGKIKGMGPGSTSIQVSMGTANTVINVTVKPFAKITATTGTAFKEGSENGQLITVKLTNGDINANPDNTTVKLTGLPDGITQGKVTWLSKTSLTIALVGNSTVDYDTNATAIVTIDKGQVTPAQLSDLTSPVTLKATVETTPAAPAISFSFDGINAGKLKGIKADLMEYSLDGGTGYITALENDQKLTNDELASITATNDIRIRVKETFRSPAGLAKKIDILPSPAAPAVKANDLTNTVTGIAKTMEFSKDGGTTWAKYVSVASLGDMRGDIALLVRKYITGVTLTGQTAALNFTAATPNLKITAATGTTFKEGSENGQLITVKLTNGDINANPDHTTVKLTGLPDGITQGKVTWLSKTSLTIALVGNSTVDYDTNATAIVTIDKGQVTPAQTSDLTCPVTLKATVETTPAAPAITFSFDGINAGKLMGIKAGTMEYSLDGGTGYITAVQNDQKLSNDELASITATNDIRIRVKETFRSPAGLVKKIDILPSPAAPAVKANDITNTVTGIAKTMEFSKDGGTTWAKYVSTASLGDMSGNITLLVRKSGVRVTMPGAITTLEFTELEVNADLNKALGEAQGSSDT